MLAALGTKARSELRQALEARAGVEAVFFDEDRAKVWVVCAASAETDRIRNEVVEGLREAGLDVEKLDVRLVGEPATWNQRRVRLIGVERENLPDGHVAVRTTLELESRTQTGRASGERSEAIELRTAALATLDALHALVAPDLDLRLVGIKQFRAFDAELVVVSIYRAGTPPQRYVGTVLQTGSASEAASRAVLHALNRLLGNYLDRQD